MTDALKPGANQLEIKITNEWTNRQIGDRSVPAERQVLTRGGGARAGGRGGGGGAFGRVQTLADAGLIGPVTILSISGPRRLKPRNESLMNNRIAKSILLATIVLSSTAARGQVEDKPSGNPVAGIPVNYTETNVGNYTLPDPLKMDNGQPVKDAKTWTEQRRPELLKYYQSEIYGRIPATAPKVTWLVVSNDNNALGGIAIMKQLAGHMGSPDGPAIGVTLYTPARATKPVPILVSISFNFGAGRAGGRGAVSTNSASPPTTGTVAQAAVPALRGPRGGGFAVRGTPAELITNGFGYATIVYNSIETDAEGQTNINLARKLALAPGQTAPAADEWGTIAAWAWGISRVVDYLETDKAVDAKRIAITGVSRLGKTVLWAGANDPRIALVIASCSGEGGAALARRNYGETIAHLVAPSRYPYQFAGNYSNTRRTPANWPSTHIV